MKIEDLTYRAVIDELFKDCPQNVTWYRQADWLRETYSQEHIAEVFKSIYRDLCTISDINNDHEEADYIRDCCDPIWLAGTQSLLQEKITEILIERGGVK